MKRSELAMRYFPMKSEAEARRMLSRWIYRCPELVDELKKINPTFYKSIYKSLYFSYLRVKR